MKRNETRKATTDNRTYKVAQTKKGIKYKGFDRSWKKFRHTQHKRHARQKDRRLGKEAKEKLLYQQNMLAA